MHYFFISPCHARTLSSTLWSSNLLTPRFHLFQYSLPNESILWSLHVVPMCLNIVILNRKIPMCSYFFKCPILSCWFPPLQTNSLVSSESLSSYSLPILQCIIPHQTPWWLWNFPSLTFYSIFFRNHVRKTWEILRRIGSLISMMRRSSPPSVKLFLVQLLQLEGVVSPHKDFTWGGAAMESQYWPCRENL